MGYENLSDIIRLLHSTSNENMAIYGAILKVNDPKEIKEFYNGYVNWVKKYGDQEETKMPEQDICKKINRVLQYAVKNASDTWHTAVPELNACKTEKKDDTNLFEEFYREYKNQAVYEAINLITDPAKIKKFTEEYTEWCIDHVSPQADPKLAVHSNINSMLAHFGYPYIDNWVDVVPDLVTYTRRKNKMR